MSLTMGASARTPSFWVPVVKFQLQREGVFNTGTLKLLPRFLLLRATCSVFCPRRRSVDRFARFIRQGQVLKVSKIRHCDSVSCSDIMGLHRNIVAHTRRTAVSVEWPGRKPDCSDGRRSADDRYCISWRATRRSRRLHSTDKFDIGRYELTSVASKPAFFTYIPSNAQSTNISCISCG